MTTLHGTQEPQFPGPAIAEVEVVRSALQAEQASRMQAEAALRESEQRWRFAIEGAGDGLWDWDMESGHVFYSSRWKSMLGYADSDIPPHIQAWGELAHPDDKQRVLDAVQQHLDGSTPEFVQEYRIRCKDGSWKWLLSRGIALRDPKRPGAVRMLGVNTDITARKESEARIEYLAYYDPLTGLAAAAAKQNVDDRIDQARIDGEQAEIVPLLGLDHRKDRGQRDRVEVVAEAGVVRGHVPFAVAMAACQVLAHVEGFWSFRFQRRKIPKVLIASSLYSNEKGYLWVLFHYSFKLCYSVFT